MSTYSPNQITGKYYSIIGNCGNGVALYAGRSYCIDYNQATWNILGIWEDGEECLKMYMNDPAKNRIGGWQGLEMNMSCWDALSEIHKNEHDKRSGCERHWFLRRKTCDKLAEK